MNGSTGAVTMSTIYENEVRPEFDPHSERYHVHHDTDSTWKASTTIVLAIKNLVSDDARMLPLTQAVDPDVLESHLQGRIRGAQLSFEFHGHEVTVRDDGDITITPLEEG